MIKIQKNPESGKKHTRAYNTRSGLRTTYDWKKTTP